MRTIIEMKDGTKIVEDDQIPTFMQCDDGNGFEVSMMDGECLSMGDGIPLTEVKRVIWES